MLSKKTASLKEASRYPHPTDWHGEVALRLRGLYAHRLDHAETMRPGALDTVIGIPWSEWAALSEERSRLSQRGPGDPPHAGFMGHGVDYQGKAYNDAIPVFGRAWEASDSMSGGTVYFWFYPKL